MVHPRPCPEEGDGAGHPPRALGGHHHPLRLSGGEGGDDGAHQPLLPPGRAPHLRLRRPSPAPADVLQEVAGRHPGREGSEPLSPERLLLRGGVQGRPLLLPSREARSRGRDHPLREGLYPRERPLRLQEAPAFFEGRARGGDQEQRLREGRPLPFSPELQEERAR